MASSSDPQPGRSAPTECDIESPAPSTDHATGPRYYDGLALKEDGTYEGIEVKSGSSPLTPNQRAVDDAINSGQHVGTATINAETVRITSVVLQRVG